MQKFDTMTPGEILADVSVADFVRELALGIAEAQAALNKSSIDSFIQLAHEPIPGLNKTAIELGLSPPFYHFQYADLEMKVHLCMRLSKDFGLNLKLGYGNGASADESASSTSTDTATISVIQGDGAPATAVILVRANAEGTIKVGDASFALVQPPAGAGETEIYDDLATTGGVLGIDIEVSADSKVDRSMFEIVYGKPPVKPTTNAPDAFQCTDNHVRIAWATADEPARAWFDVKPLATTGDLKLGFITSVANGGAVSDTATITPSSGSNAAAGLTAAINAYTNTAGDHEYEAFHLIKGGNFTEVVYFEYNKSTPIDNADNRAALARLARYLQAVPVASVKLIGHTDRTGRSSYNDSLGTLRATSVQDLLLACGISTTRAITDTRGEREPVSTNNDTANYWKDRRVSIQVTSGPSSVVAVTTIATGATWASKAIAAPLGTLIKALDGSAKIEASAGDWVEVGSTHLEVDATDGFALGNDPEQTATNLAAAINANVPNHSAFAVDDLVTILGPGSMVRLTLTTTAIGTAANSTKLENATGSLSIASKFKGGADAADPETGDTVSIGPVNIRCIDAGDTPAADEFAEGANAAETAANLAAAINRVDGLSAAVAGSKITVTGPSGTSIATSNPQAFLLSGSRLGNRVQSATQARSQASAFTASFDVHYNRKYDVSVEGTSSIKARLVALPAPVEFLDEIRTYLLTWR